jgi:general secretion pathway protein G
MSKPVDADNWSGPYVKGDGNLLDPWNHPYVYRDPSNRSGLDYDLCSLGPNGQNAAADSSNMICNH